LVLFSIRVFNPRRRLGGVVGADVRIWWPDAGLATRSKPLSKTVPSFERF